MREAVETGILQKQIEDARNADDDHRRLGPDRGRDMQIVDLLRESLQSFHGCVDERTHVHAREQEQGYRGDPAPGAQQPHSFTVAGKSSSETTTNTMS